MELINNKKIKIILIIGASILCCSFRMAKTFFDNENVVFVTIKNKNQINNNLFNSLNEIGIYQIERITLNPEREKNIVFRGYSTVSFDTLKNLSVSNDKYYLEEGGCGISGYIPSDKYYDYNWFNEDIYIEEARDETKGNNGIRVAIIDSGVDMDHEDLNINKNLSISLSPESSDKEFFVDDHGTMVAGIINAPHNNLGVAGIAPKVDVISINVGYESNGETYFDYNATIEAINYCTSKNVDIINFSGYNFPYSEAMKSTIEDFPGLFITIAGNSNTNLDVNPTYPACFNTDNMIVVGGFAHTGFKYNSSSYGTKSVDLFAPGVGVMSTAASGYESKFYGKYNPYTGTSAAAPIVSGIAALAMSNNPTFSINQIKSKIMNSTTKINSLDGLCKTGGLINAFSSIHQHVYDEYKYLDKKYHYSICACGEKVKSGHVVAGGSFSDGQRYATCLLCGGEAEMGFVVSGRSSNISLIDNFDYINGEYYSKETKYIDHVLNLSYEDYISFKNGDFVNE